MNKILFLFMLLTVCALAEPQFTHTNVLGRDVAVWTPDTPPPSSGYPLVLFSHGFTGCNTQSVFLMQALAKAGYVVIAPNHRDATCGTARERGNAATRMAILHPQEPFRDPDKWSDNTYRDRAEDIETVLNEALRPGSFVNVPIDQQRIGIAGHSLGGYTALGLAGGWAAWKDKRIKAVLALSPHCSPFVVHGNLDHLDVPVMYQGGSRDIGETKIVIEENGAYDLTSKPKYFVDFKGAGHFAWTNFKSEYRDPINAYSVAFFNLYLKDDGSGLASLMKTPAKLVDDARADTK
jgi:predicted dienelactone hydrolase